MGLQMKKRTKMSLLLVGMSVALLGCNASKKAADLENQANQEDTKVSSKVLNLMEGSEIGSMDTIFTQDEPSVNAQSNVFEGL